MRRFTALLATAAIVTFSGSLAAQPQSQLAAQQRDTVKPLVDGTAEHAVTA